ncbi:MAG: amino acid ABC transporter ATP-binding protein [Planctomycetota bacterium]
MVAVNEIVLENVTKRYGGRLVLDGVSMAIGQGETVALVGPSGGGKSTLLRCINGLCPFDSGEIRVGGHRLTPAAGSPMATAAVRRLYGMIFQDFQLFPHMTALQNVMEAPRQVLRKPLDECRRQAIDLLERVGLAERLHDYPRQLSGGQRQRVAIARALAMSPSGLLCDEITSALDPELKSEVLSALGELKRVGLTLILVTHEIHFARRAADRVFFLADGQIVEQGPASEVLDTPRTPRAQQFLRQVLA